jgi:hypothetical protein
MFSSLLPAIIGGGMSLFGGLMQNQANTVSAQATNAFNAHQANINRHFNAVQADRARAWQRAQNFQANEWARNSQARAFEFTSNMANTAHQRQMADMRAAGLNPILSARHGGANTPTGPTPTGGSVSGPTATGSAAAGVMARMEDVLGKGASSALQSLQVRNQTQLAKQQVAQSIANTHNLREQKKLIQADVRVRNADAAFRETQNAELLSRIPLNDSNTALNVARRTTEGLRPAHIQAQTRESSAREHLARATATLRRLEEQGSINKQAAAEIINVMFRLIGDAGGADRLHSTARDVAKDLSKKLSQPPKRVERTEQHRLISPFQTKPLGVQLWEYFND